LIEIGSEFWDVPIKDDKNTLFPDSIQWFLSGRSALKAIVDELKDCYTVALPSWCCESMIIPFLESGISVQFYPVYFDSGLVQDIAIDCDAILIMDYFGYKSQTPDLYNYHGKTICDLTHSLFSSFYTKADYYFGSLRKWCGFWTGGYAWTEDGHELLIEDKKDDLYISLREKAMRLKADYIKSENSCKNEKGFLDVFARAEARLDEMFIAPADERDVQLAYHLDIDDLRNRRRENAEILIDEFMEWSVFTEVNPEDCPLFVPIIVPHGKRDE